MGTTVTPTDTDTVTWENAPLMLNPKPMLPLKLMPLLMLTTDITDTHMPMDMAVTMVDTTERDLLMLNPKLKPNPKLMPPPGTDTTVDTTVIPTDTDMLVPTDTMAVTGGKLFTMN